MLFSISNRLILVILFAAYLSLVSCCAKSCPPIESSRNCDIKQKILFHLAYFNYAWGYQNNGFFIDNEGLIKYYNIKSEKDWRKADSGYYSKTDLEYNYRAADSITGKVDRVELCHYYNLIESASEQKLSKRVHSAYDAGASTFIAYIWDENREKYKMVFLSMEGDFSRDNLNPNAIAIADWLRQKFNCPRIFPAPPVEDSTIIQK